MKYLYALPLLLLLLTSCKDEKKEAEEQAIDLAKTDWATHKLKGKVKSFSEKSYTYASSVKGAFGNENQKLDTDIAFNSRGMQLLEKKYNGAGIAEENTYDGKKNLVKTVQYINGKPGIITQYSRDKRGNITSIIRRDKSNAQIDRIEMKFEGKNMVEKTTYNNQDHPIDMNTYAYDKKGNMTGESVFMGTHSAKVRATYEYDEKGHKIGEIRYTEDKITDKTAYVYENEKLISKKTTDGNGIIEFSENSTYDKDGNLTNYFRYEKLSNSRIEENYTYDSNKNMLSFLVKENDKPVLKTLYTYDNNNNLISVISTDGAGKLLDKRSYTYQYDENNNWTKKTVDIKGEPAFILERTYSYY